MVTVADILALPAFVEVQIAAPFAGAGLRQVHSFVILDFGPAEGAYDGYRPGDFIITNLGFAQNDAAQAKAALLSMIKRDVAGIAVKTVYYQAVDETVRAASEEAGVPLYLYVGEYHEVVAYQALGLIRRDAEEADKERSIDRLLADHDDRATRAALFELAGTTGSTLQCFAVSPRRGDDCSLYATLDVLEVALLAFRHDWASVSTAYACLYHRVLLVFVSYTKPAASVRSVSETDLISRIGASGRVRMGVGEETPLEEGDTSVREALASLKTAQNESEDVVRWADLHHDAFRAAANAGRLFARTSALHRALLEEHDTEQGAELAITAKALAHAYGDVRLAAEALHQHPNTVRYRLRKAKDVLGMPDSPDREFAFLLGLVYLEP